MPPAAERRWDSEMRRWRARSLARKAAESSGSSGLGFFLVVVVGVGVEEVVGGREDWGG